jgi:hypothetical protein
VVGRPGGRPRGALSVARSHVVCQSTVPKDTPPTSGDQIHGSLGDWIRWRFLGNLQEALVENEGKLARKALSLSLALASLFGAVALMGGYFLVAITVGWLVT